MKTDNEELVKLLRAQVAEWQPDSMVGALVIEAALRFEELEKAVKCEFDINKFLTHKHEREMSDAHDREKLLSEALTLSLAARPSDYTDNKPFVHTIALVMNEVR